MTLYKKYFNSMLGFYVYCLISLRKPRKIQKSIKLNWINIGKDLILNSLMMLTN